VRQLKILEKADQYLMQLWQRKT